MGLTEYEGTILRLEIGIPQVVVVCEEGGTERNRESDTERRSAQSF